MMEQIVAAVDDGADSGSDVDMSKFDNSDTEFVHIK